MVSKSTLFGCLVLLAISAAHADQATPSQSPAASPAAAPAGGSTTPVQLVNATPKGQLKNPYKDGDAAAVEANVALGRRYETGDQPKVAAIQRIGNASLGRADCHRHHAVAQRRRGSIRGPETAQTNGDSFIAQESIFFGEPNRRVDHGWHDDANFNFAKRRTVVVVHFSPDLSLL